MPSGPFSHAMPNAMDAGAELVQAYVPDVQGRRKTQKRNEKLKIQEKQNQNMERKGSLTFCFRAIMN